MLKKEAKISDFKAGTGESICIRGPDVQINDTIVISNGLDSAEGRVHRVNSSELVIDWQGRLVICSPWRSGAAPISRYPGTSSNWTIIRIDEREPAF